MIKPVWKTLHAIHVGMLIGVENGKTKVISLEGQLNTFKTSNQWFKKVISTSTYYSEMSPRHVVEYKLIQICKHNIALKKHKSYVHM